jgi:hypothetical protein
MKNQIPIIDKDFLLNESKVFCILPWIHLMMSPSGNIFPCCVTADQEPYSSINSEILDSINSEKFKELRLNMINEKKSSTCQLCYKTDEIGNHSFRKGSNAMFGHYVNDVLNNTNNDGSLIEFKMRYFDIRSSNICNFKCRTCGSDYSSSFSQEEVKLLKKDKSTIIIKPSSESNSLEKILNQLDSLEMIYFAGGEPIIMDEHYIIIEELIRRKKTDLSVRYNTNLSNLKFKDKDLVDLWKHFKRVEINASLDHFGKRAEYIRNGTNWSIVESNIFKILEMENVNFGFNTVVSVFNYSSLSDFLKYMTDISIYNSKTAHYVSFNISYTPNYYDPIILPDHIKKMSGKKILESIDYLKAKGINHEAQLKSIVDYVNSDNKWNDYKSDFQRFTKLYDNARNESFSETFPELAEMVDQ